MRSALQTPSLVIAASTLISCYFVLLVGDAVPAFFASAYHAQSLSDVAILMPALTRFAVRHAWAFAFVTVLVGVAIALLSKRCAARGLQFVAIGLSAQGLVVWFAMFCYCYDNFQGPVSLHHAQRFDLENLFRFAFGVFPVTLCAILIPGFCAFLSFNDRSA